MPASSSVLIVDDNAVVRQFARTVLERTGREVTVAQDGVEATLLLENRSFDLVLTDLDMPRRSGLEVIADLRRISPSTRIVAMSGEWIVSATDVRRMAANLGVRAFLTKPFVMRQLLEVIEGDLSVPSPWSGLEMTGSRASVA